MNNQKDLKDTAALINDRMSSLDNAGAYEASQAQRELEPDLRDVAEMLEEISNLRAEYGEALAALNQTDFTRLQLRFGINEGLIMPIRRIVNQAHILLEATYSFLLQVPVKAKQVEDRFMLNSLRREIEMQRSNAGQVRSYLHQLFDPRSDRYGRLLPSLIEQFNSRLEVAGLPPSTKVFLKTERREMPTSYEAVNPGGDEGLEGQPH